MNVVIAALSAVLTVLILAPSLGISRSSLAPRCGLAFWAAILIFVLFSLASVGLILTVPLLRRVGGLHELIHRCPQFFASIASHPGWLSLALLGLTATGSLAARLTYCVLQEIQAMHEGARRQSLLLLGAQAHPGGFHVIHDDRRAAWSSASRSIVLTTGAVTALDDDQLEAVLAQERAHIDGHHHYLLALAGAVERALPSRLSRSAARNIASLIEMRADDVATTASGLSSVTLATALVTLSAIAPSGSLAAGISCQSHVRFERLISPRSAPWWWTGLNAIAVTTLILVPLVLTLIAFAPVTWLHFCPLPA